MQIDFEHKLGVGEYGVVYRGEWNGMQVAVKELQGGAKSSDAAKTAFAGEAKLMSQIGEHPYVLVGLLFVFFGFLTPN